jgi:SHS2 domain-containing protein
MEPTPLDQRKTGRRAQRRKERVHKDDKDDSLEKTTANSETRHGPSAEKERLIDEMIEQRRQTMKQSAINTDGYDEEPEILGNYEYLDHTADIQLHGWGDTLERALEQVAIAMFGYMTSLSRIQVDEEQSKTVANEIVVKGHDLQSLTFAFLQEWLYIFHESGFVAKEVQLRSIDRESFKACSSARGEIVDWKRHTQGTEVKAVTYSNLQINEEEGRCDIWVIVDI